MKPVRLCVPLLLLALTLVCAWPAPAAERSDIPEKYKWNLADLYPTEDGWRAAKQDIVKRIPGLESFQGRLGVSADSFYLALSTMMDLSRDLSRLYTYASQRSDEDTRVSQNVEMVQSAEQLFVQYGTASSYVRPEILALGADKVRGFVTANPKLKDYTPWLEDILRWAPHTLTPAEEKIAARAGLLADAGGSIRNLFASAELPYPEVTLTSGEKVRIDPAAYTLYRARPNRTDRDSVFRAFWNKHREFKATFGASLYAQVKAHLYNRDVHKFGSCLEAALFSANIPTNVYKQLLDDVHANLPTLHRYLKLRQRMMGVDQLRYEDLYAPIVKEVDLKYTPEQGMDLTLQALAPLGPEYVQTLKKGFESRWIDWMPSTGKRSGAYSTGAYGVHPYQLQNFTGLYEEVSTLAHESGHSMHTYYSFQRQPYVTSDYATFVAEVASTLNENLLTHYMVDHTKDKATQLFLLGTYLDGLRTTLFRQTLFAEFELKIHEMAERGETLTGDNLTQLYLGLVRQYYGHDQGVCKVDELYGVEWAYIHHFFYNFYVYQYATSIVASTSISQGIRSEAALKKPATKSRDAYLRMLSSGSSKYPIDLLKEAGVDMTTPAPFSAAMKEMNAIMDQMERLLK